MIYTWVKLRGCTNRLIADYNRDLSPDRFLFLKGIKLTPEQVTKKPIFDHELTRTEVSKYDNIPNNCSSPLVNQKIIDILCELAPNEVQFFDAEVHCKDGILTDYKLLNVTRTFVGIDHERSICQMMKGEPDVILGFHFLTYKQGCMDTIKIARDAEYLGNLLVTEEIKQRFKHEKITGLRFVRPEDYWR